MAFQPPVASVQNVALSMKPQAVKVALSTFPQLAFEYRNYLIVIKINALLNY
jgi:hypothetical protein